MKIAIYICLSIFLLMSFTTDKKFTLDTKSDETIVFGKFDIYNRGDLKDKDIAFLFDNIQTRKNYKIKLDQEGYFIKKIEPGVYEIKQVYYKNKYINLPHRYLTTIVNEANSLFYIGNIYINWSPIHYERTSSPYFYASFGLMGAIASIAYDQIQESNVDLMPAIVRDKEETIKRFNNFYPQNTKTIKYAPINIEIYNQ